MRNCRNTRANVIASVIFSQVSLLLILRLRRFANLQTAAAAIDLVSSSTYRVQQPYRRRSIRLDEYILVKGIKILSDELVDVALAYVPLCRQ